MCGIAGILRVHAPGSDVPRPLDAIPEAWLDILDDSIKHRGPDGRGRFRQRTTRPDGATIDVALVHRRLSIIDHAGGAQPMLIGAATSASKGARGARRGVARAEIPRTTPPLVSLEASSYAPPPSQHICPACSAKSPGTLAVVFNGCIYNHRELRRELESAGHAFHTDHSDTEVLLHGWKQWGPELTDHLDGMYAAAIWDESQARAQLLRDRFGEKPLYTLFHPAQLSPINTPLMAWSSSCASLSRLQGAAGIPATSAGDPLKGWIKFGWNQATPTWTSPGELWVGRCLPLPLQPTGQEAHDPLEGNRGWWSEALQPGDTTLSPHQVDTILRASVQSRLDADVPLGCFLSGGIDSAIITRYASEVARDLTAFTVRMPDPSMDESAAAAATAAHLGVRHEVLDCDARPAEDLVTLIHQLGLPFGDSSLLPTTWVSRAARQAVTVALAGDGGDELFLGYDRHRAIGPLARATAMPPQLRRLALNFAVSGRNPRSRRARAARLLGALAGQGYKDLVAIFPTPLDDQLGVRCTTPFDHFGMTYAHDAQTTWLWALRFDRLFYLPEDLLRKTDTASMSVALEVRAPFLANDVAQLAFNASPASLMPYGQRKGLLRAVARKYLSADIVDRPKMGFAIPISDWFRTDYGGMRQLLLDHLNTADPFPGLADCGINLNMVFIRQMLKEHDDAGTASLWPWKGRDHGQRLYMLLVLSIWCRWLQRVRRGE